MTIQSFANKETEKVYKGAFSKKLPQDIQGRACQKLLSFEEAETLADIRNVAGNHLEVLRGNRKGQHSIRVNDQYRICFIVVGTVFHDVEIADYH